VPDEPTIGEVVRLIAGLQRTVDQLSGKVLTVEVWKAERESMEFRIRENEKDIATVQAEAKAERDIRQNEKRLADERASTMRRQSIFAVLTSFVAPILVGLIVALLLKG